MKKKINNQVGRRQKAKQEAMTAAGFDGNKAYVIAEALESAKKMSLTKFDSSVEVHFKLGIDPKKGDQQIRAALNLPFGTGKQIKVAAFVSAANEQACRQAGADLVGGEELIEEIAKSEKTDFQVAVAEPAIMRSLSKIAKVLGTRGLMPSPKNETVTANPAVAVAELKKGKISFKNDDTANLHVIIGKTSFATANLVENFNALLDAVKKAKPASSKGTFIKNCVISTTMGPGIKVQL